MKILDALIRVERSVENKMDADYEALCHALRVDPCWDVDWDTFSKKLQAYSLTKWQCTDTWVGTLVYFLDEELVGMSHQSARKSGINYYFINEEAGQKVRDFLRTFVKNEPIPLLDLDEDFPDFYTVNWSGELLSKEGLVNGEVCRVVSKENSSMATKIVVQFRDGSSKTVEVSEFKIPCHFGR